MEIEMHRYDYLRDANPGLYQRHLDETFEKYGIEPPPQQEQEPSETQAFREGVAADTTNEFYDAGAAEIEAAGFVWNAETSMYELPEDNQQVATQEINA